MARALRRRALWLDRQQQPQWRGPVILMAVLCAAIPTTRLPRGVAMAYESSAKFDPVETDGPPLDRGGCLNQLSTKRTQVRQSSAMGSSTVLVEVERWGNVFGAEAAAQ